jgi:hypothetical protein
VCGGVQETSTLLGAFLVGCSTPSQFSQRRCSICNLGHRHTVLYSPNDSSNCHIGDRRMSSATFQSSAWRPRMRQYPVI